MIERTDFIAVPVQDRDRAAQFYGEVLGLTKNPNSTDGWWEWETGNVTLAFVDPAALGMSFAPLPVASIVLRVGDFDAARAKLANAGVPLGCQTVLLRGVNDDPQIMKELMQKLLKNRVRPPYLGAYPMSFTTINYMSLDFLVPYLIDFEKRRIAELEKDLAGVTEEEPKELLNSLLEMKQRHLATLTNLTGLEKPAA